MAKNGNIKEATENYFSPFDLQMGKFLSAGESDNKKVLHLTAALLSRQVRDGHVCMNLREFAGRVLQTCSDQKDSILCPELSIWLEALKNANCVGCPGDFKPMILDDNHRLYFQRYWQYEQDVAEFINRTMLVQPEVATKNKTLKEKLQFYFPDMSPEKIFWPSVAAAAALMRKFLVITGSPGTGKTTTITKIMAFMLDVKNKPLRIALCAPTGKAAARLEESVKKTKTILPCPETVKNQIPEEAMTLHRLLGSIRHSPYFHYNGENILPYDLVVVDEASMVDLPMMAKLMTALNPNAQLILLGDKDQLASVDTGAVLGSICFPDPLNIFSREFEERLTAICVLKTTASNVAPGVQDSIIELKHNYRFSKESGIGLLSQAIKRGDSQSALQLIDAAESSDIHFSEIFGPENILVSLREKVIKPYREYLQIVISSSMHTEDIFDLFETFRVLCALRIGMWGSQRMNVLIEKLLSEAGLIDLTVPYYEGRPIMIVQNDYRLHLFNGDVGIVLKDTADKNKLKVLFRNEKQGFRKIAPERLPRHETVWAMTVHKSQGSEFNKVILILSDNDNPVLTRELLYTGITRARFYADISANRDVLTKTISKQILRQSGLTDAIVNRGNMTSR
jgi:exodeoxyribonuclease V alpha subunit